jgi:hypothetical protein
VIEGDVSFHPHVLGFQINFLTRYGYVWFRTAVAKLLNYVQASKKLYPFFSAYLVHFFYLFAFFAFFSLPFSDFFATTTTDNYAPMSVRQKYFLRSFCTPCFNPELGPLGPSFAIENGHTLQKQCKY